MYIVYLYSFIDKKEVFVGLTDDLNFQLELEKKFFNTIDLKINNITIVYHGTNKSKAIDEKQIWIAKTNNINSNFDNTIPYDFILKSLKDKKNIKDSMHLLETNYMELFYKYETLKENYKNIDEIIELVIQDNINDWKDFSLSYKINSIKKDNIDTFDYDVNGFDKYGYDREGYDKNGFDDYGYDRNGFDDYGFNREGQHKDDL